MRPLCALCQSFNSIAIFSWEGRVNVGVGNMIVSVSPTRHSYNGMYDWTLLLRVILTRWQAIWWWNDEFIHSFIHWATILLHVGSSWWPCPCLRTGPLLIMLSIHFLSHFISFAYHSASNIFSASCPRISTHQNIHGSAWPLALGGLRKRKPSCRKARACSPALLLHVGVVLLKRV